MASSTPRGARSVGALLVAVLGLSTTPATAQRPEAQCRAMYLENVWLQSTAQADDGSLLAVNPLELNVLKISPDGRVAGAFTGLRIGKRTFPFNPTRIQRLDDGTLLLANAADEIAQVQPLPATRLLPKSGLEDLDFRVQSSSLPIHASGIGADRLVALYGWSGTSDGHVLAFADFIRANESEASGFVWFNRWDPTSFKLLYEVEADDPETQFYFVMHPYVASVGNRAYFLSMGPTASIYEYTAGENRARKLAAFPEEVRVQPQIPEERGASGIPKIFEAMADATTPLGIYSWVGSDDIGLLARRPKGDGATDYTLTRIDPEEDEILYTLHLPAEDARHITLAPGERHWIALLKAEVEALGKQDVTGILRLPAEWFKGRASPLAQAGMRVACR